ncbi:hypothetical protein JHK87_001788 [Glycine soja]|nr:hypothetical protein JHK87_001788 [Glycine soja]
MIRSDHAYTEIINKAMEDAQRKANSHHVLEFDQYDIRFIVQEAINPRKVQPVGNFTIRAYIDLVYTLESVSNVYRGLFEELRNEAYWPSTSRTTNLV